MSRVMSAVRFLCCKHSLSLAHAPWHAPLSYLIKVRRFLPRFSRSELTSSKILSQRSAVPPVSSRVVTKRKAQITQQDKIRLLRVARRPRIGPFGALVEP